MSLPVRVAWLIPSLELGAYWQPVLEELAAHLEGSVVFTGRAWPGFDSTAAEGSRIEVLGRLRSLRVSRGEGYERRIMWLSPSVVSRLRRWAPDVVVAQAFSLWTLIACLLKRRLGSRLVILWEGSTPNTDYRDSLVRTLFRRWMASRADLLVTNSRGGGEYLARVLQAPAEKIVPHTYIVPHRAALCRRPRAVAPLGPGPTFLYVGRLEPRKGLESLVEASAGLRSASRREFSVRIVGRGPQRPQLEELVRRRELESQFHWEGWVDYGALGSYYEAAQAVVLPTLEDTWGMVVAEAMAFGKPVLCSRLAGVAELVTDGVNGFVFDPRRPEELARAMRRLVEEPGLAAQMGERAARTVAELTPPAAARGLLAAVSSLTSRRPE